VIAYLRRHRWVVIGALIAVAVVVILAPLASSDPDGLDRVARDKEFTERTDDPGWKIFEGYSVPGIDNGALTTVVAGLAGVVIVFSLPLGLGYLARRRRGEQP